MMSAPPNEPSKQGVGAALTVAASTAEAFEPTNLGRFTKRFRFVCSRVAGLRQSEVLRILDAEKLKVRAEAADPQDGDLNRLAYLLSLAVMRDYVSFGYLPVIQRERCFLVPVFEAGGLTDAQRRSIVQSLFRQARTKALLDRGQHVRLAEISSALTATPSDCDQVRTRLAAGTSAIVLQEAAAGSKSLGSREVWRAVRSTWSTTPDSSAPGREVSLLAFDEISSTDPLGIIQLRNVVPEIVARDRWLGITAGFLPDETAVGYLRFLDNAASDHDRLEATQSVLLSLLAHINPDGLPPDPATWEPGGLTDLARSARQRFEDERQVDRNSAQTHLRVVKRAETGSDLLRGIHALEAMLASDAPVSLVRRDEQIRRDLNAGLRKIWHYHMGFVALEMSVCGAAPPFGPMRVGKLMAALAGTQMVVDCWGDRPLGEIASHTYLQSVRDAVPNPGPLVVFTSGLYAGHSAQYNRVDSGLRRWRKIGETQGYGSFHVSVETAQLAGQYNTAVDGYDRITRRFGEGSSARFRAIGRALNRLELPDLLKHKMTRPLYALPLVRDVPGALLGWASEGRGPLPTPDEIYRQWWERWVMKDASRLADRSRQSLALRQELAGITLAVEQLARSEMSPS